MNLFKIGGFLAMAAGWFSNEELIMLLGILITVLGMLQDYLKTRRNLRDLTI